MSERKKVVVVLSGGQDSTTCLYQMLTRYPRQLIHTVTFDYGQRHARELVAAGLVAKLAGVTHEFINVRGTLQGTSPLVSDNKLEQYEDHQSLPSGLEKTFVPMRNQMFLTIAANRAFVLGADTIVTGVSQEDYGGYPDCRLEFIRSFEKTTRIGTFEDAERSFDVVTPLSYLDKHATVELAMTLPGCYEALALTHTSYDGEYPPIGKDHATLLRAKGFEMAEIPDPLVVRAILDGLYTDDTYPGPSELYGESIADVDEKYVRRVARVTKWLRVKT